MSTSLAAVFLEHLDEARAGQLDHPGLEQQLTELLACARACWPAVELPGEDFARHLAQVAGRPDNAEVTLEQLHTDDLYLAAACAAGDEGAIAACDAAISPEMDRTLARMELDTSAADEIKQLVREELFVAGSDGRPYIGVYAGRGRLGGWVRVIATRRALKSFRGKKRQRPLEGAELDRLAEQPGLLGGGGSAEGDSPERELMKVLYRQELKAALVRAVSKLSEKDRALLQDHIIDGMSIDQLGERAGVHRATAARWLARAKDALIAAVRREMMQRLRLDEATYRSVMALVRSRFELSVRILLGPE